MVETGCDRLAASQDQFQKKKLLNKGKEPENADRILLIYTKRCGLF